MKKIILFIAVIFFVLFLVASNPLVAALSDTTNILLIEKVEKKGIFDKVVDFFDVFRSGSKAPKPDTILDKPKESVIDTGYKLPEGYTEKVEGLDGLKVVDESKKSIEADIGSKPPEGFDKKIEGLNGVKIFDSKQTENTKADSDTPKTVVKPLIKKKLPLLLQNWIYSRDPKLTASGDGIFAKKFGHTTILTHKSKIALDSLFYAKKGDINFVILDGEKGLKNVLNYVGPDSAIDGKDIAFKRQVRELLKDANSDSASVTLLNKAVEDGILDVIEDNLWVDGNGWNIKNGLYILSAKSKSVKDNKKLYKSNSVPVLLDVYLVEQEEPPVIATRNTESFFVADNQNTPTKETFFYQYPGEPCEVGVERNVEEKETVAIPHSTILDDKEREITEALTKKEIFIGYIYGNEGMHSGEIGYKKNKWGYSLIIGGLDKNLIGKIKDSYSGGKLYAGGKSTNELEGLLIGFNCEHYFNLKIESLLGVGVNYRSASEDVAKTEFYYDANGLPYLPKDTSYHLNKNGFSARIYTGLKKGPLALIGGYDRREKLIMNIRIYKKF